VINDGRRSFGDGRVDAAVTVATRSAAVETGAIEGLYSTTRGFTRTIAEMSEGWEATLHRSGTEVEGPVRDAFAAYEYLIDAVTGSQPIVAKWIRELHAVICASQQTHRVHVHTPAGFQPEDRPLPKGE